MHALSECACPFFPVMGFLTVLDVLVVVVVVGASGWADLRATHGLL